MYYAHVLFFIAKVQNTFTHNNNTNTHVLFSFSYL